MKKHVVLNEEQKKLELSLKLSMRIGQLFGDLKLDQKAFFIESKFDPRKFHRLFLNNANPTFHSICEIAEALKVHPMEILNFDLNQRIKKIRKKQERYDYSLTYIVKY